MPGVAKLLERDDAGHRVLAARTLVKIAPGDPAAVEALAGAMSAPDWDERWRAAGAVKKLEGDP